MKDSKSYAHGSRYYEQLKVLDEMNDSRSRYLRLLDAINNSRSRITRMILGYEPMTLNAMNSSGLSMQ